MAESQDGEFKNVHYSVDKVSPYGTANTVIFSTLSLNFDKGGEAHSIELKKTVRKDANAYSIKAPRRLLEDIKYYGLEKTSKWLISGIHKAAIFRSELRNLRRLNQLGNQFVPKIIKEEGRAYEMDWVYGIDYIRYKASPETRLTFFKEALEGIQSVFKDGFINFEYARKNMVIQLDYTTGMSTGMILLDWGLSYPINKDGTVTIDVGLLRGSKVRVDNDHDGSGLMPPEARVKKGKVRINADKALVWSLAQRLVPELLYEEIAEQSDFILRCRNDNPDKRPTFAEFVDFYRNFPIDTAKIEPCVSSEELVKLQQMFEIPVEPELYKQARSTLPKM